MSSAPLLKCSKTGADQLTHLTALVLLPPPEIQARLNALRSAHDRSFPRFTAHITLPFVEQPDVDVAVEELRSTLCASPLQPFEVVLDHVHQFRGRHRVTVYLAPDPTSSELLCRAARVLIRVFRLTEDKVRPFSPHLTVGQASHTNGPIELLTRKARRLLSDGPLRWNLHGFMFLRKDVNDKDMLMRPYAFVSFDGQAARTAPLDSAFADPRTPATFAFSPSLQAWHPAQADLLSRHGPAGLSVAAYDLSQLTLASLKPRALLAGQPDLLALHGITDDMLGNLLADMHVRAHFAWCTHGTGSVLPFESNVVVFTTFSLPFETAPLGSSSISMHSTSNTFSAAHLDELAPALHGRPDICIVYAESQRSLLHIEEPPGYACHIDPQFALHPREPGYCILARNSCATVGWTKFRRGALGCAVLSSISLV